jgi:hypothetical protein
VWRKRGKERQGGKRKKRVSFCFVFGNVFSTPCKKEEKKKTSTSRGKKPFFLPLGLGLVVDHVKPDNVPQEQMELRVRRRVERGLEQGAEDVVDQVLEVADDALVAVDIVEPRDLDEPDDWCSFKRGTRGERVG